MVARFYLENFGYDCDLATCGAEAISKVRQQRYAAILMDVRMPNLNGLDATKTIRTYEQERNFPRTPIIGMTANAMLGDRSDCLEAGMDDYITKPVNESILKAKLLHYTGA